jgi:integrase
MFVSKNGKFYYLYYRDKTTGKRNKITTKATSKKEAEDFKEDFIYKSKQKELEVKAEEMKHYTLSQLRDYAIQFLSNQGFHFNSKNYTKLFQRLIDYTGDVYLNNITPIDIENWKQYRVNQVSKTSTNIDLRAYKAVFNKALNWGMITSNPFNKVKQFTTPQKERIIFENHELQKLLELIGQTNPRLKNIVIFAINTACRLNECVNLQWQDVNLEKRTITIRNKSNFQTKTGKIRILPISDNLLTLFMQMLQSQNGIVNLPDPNKYVFVKENGLYKYDKCYVSKKIKSYIRKAGLSEKLCFHCFRHYAITQMLRATGNIYLAKEFAGHSSIAVTTIYAHTNQTELLTAVNSMSVNF